MGGVASAVIGSQASRSAASSIANADNSASQLENRQFLQTEQNLDPYMQAGAAALPTLQGLLGTGGQAPNPTAFTSSPGYQFQMAQGTGAVQNAASATGGVNSGNTLKALTQYGQGLANNTYQQYLGNVSGMVGMGQNAANQVGNFGAANASQIGKNTIAAGTATGSGILGAAQSDIGGINAIMQAMGGTAGTGNSGNNNNNSNNQGGNNSNPNNSINLAQLFAQMMGNQSSSSVGSGSGFLGE